MLARVGGIAKAMAVWCAVGTVLTLGAAYAAAVWCPRSRVAPFHEPRPLVPASWGQAGWTGVERGLGVRAVSQTWGKITTKHRRHSGWCASEPMEEVTEPAWCSETVEVGLPWTAFHGGRVDGWQEPPVEPGRADIWRGSLRRVNQLPLSSATSTAWAPLRPWMPGFVADVVALGGVSALAWYAAGLVRSGWRFLRGRCPTRCGYDSSGLRVCPECGNAVVVIPSREAQP